MSELMKRYLFTNDKKSEVVQTIRRCLVQQYHFRDRRSIIQLAGGQSGDLYKESMTYEFYVYDGTSRFSDGAVHLYTLLDHSTNGYGHMVSLLMNLPEGSEYRQPVLDLLDEWKFVSFYDSLKDRPFGYHSFRSYLDEVPDLACLQQGFGYKREVPQEAGA